MLHAIAACQAYQVTYAQRGDSDIWVAATEMLERFCGVRSRGVVACGMAPRLARMVVFVDCDAVLCEPYAVVSPGLARDPAREALRMANRRFLERVEKATF